MKRLLFLSLMLVVGLSSCIKSIDGECEPAVFENTVTFTSDGGMKTIVAKNSVHWDFHGFYINDEYTELDKLTLSYKDGDKIWHIYKVEGEWFSVERIDYQTIKIKATKNETSRHREFKFLCDSGNCSTKISVTQP